MKLQLFPTATAFLDAVGPTLLEREAENALLLGIALRLAAGHSYGDEGDAPFLACVADGARIPVIAVRTPPYSLVLCGDEGRVDALALVADHLARAGGALPGVIGRADLADAFARIWADRTRAGGGTRVEERLYRLTAVAPIPRVAGLARWAEPGEAALLARWADAFVTEALPDSPRSDLRPMVDRLIHERDLLVWEDDGVVSMCARTRPTPNGASVSYVYTPPASRGRGYATACVAEMSRRILASGKTFCTLFADLANPTSNAIYQRIGYVPVCDCREIRFTRSPSSH